MKFIDTIFTAFNLENYIDLLIVLTHKEIKVRYKSSVLGYLWSVANPLAIAMVFFVAFKIIMRIQIEAYTLVLIAGLFPWQSFANSVNASPMIFLANASIIKKVNFPRHILPLVNVLQDTIHFIIAIPVIVIFMLIYHRFPSWNWFYGIPMLLAIQVCMVYGISLLISTINLFFRDMERITAILMMFIFYLTPIVFPESMVPEQYRWALKFSPLATLMINWRKLFLEGSIDWVYLGLSVFYAVLLLFIGYAVYKKLSWKFAEVL